ncbi:cytochrome P450 [Rickenella mellea]|uniref:Cytochrome P450 n=1 Tax=Rickenella mellea TaxID=50990 RepID=A0A4Y7QAP2_9AGAM|nr:cytochrome P450 [Rickenella mellea]
MFSAAFLILLLAWFTARFIIWRRQEDICHASGPSPKTASWIWGHELEVFQGQASEMYNKWMNMYGPLFKIKAGLFHGDIIVLGDHAAVQHVFANTDTYIKSPSFRPLVANTIGKGVVWAEGQDHTYQRRLLSPAFSLESVKNMADDISACAEKFERTLSKLAAVNGGDITLNIVPYTSYCTLDIIGRVGFGHDFKYGQSVEAKEISDSWSEIVTTGLTIGACLAPIILRAFPFITSIPVSFMQAQGQVKIVIDKLARRFMEDESQIEKGKNILSILKRAQGESDGLTTNQLIDNIVGLTVAGHETSNTWLNFTLLELARRPDIQKKLRDEALQYQGPFSYDGISKLNFLDAVAKEGLRLHAPLIQTERVAMKDDILPLTTPIKTTNGKILRSFRVQKGQVFRIAYLAMQTNPNVWGEDAAEFKPERWLIPGAMPPRNELPRGWSNLVAFSDGPRICIGYRLALFEFKVILATLIRTLEFHATDAVVQRKNTITLQPVVDGKGGVLPLRISLASHM